MVGFCRLPKHQWVAPRRARLPAMAVELSRSRMQESRTMPEPSSDDLLRAALEISAAAAAIPMRYFRSGVAVEDKADESPVTIADRETEQHIRAEIQARYPGHGILGEEFGRRETESSFTWIVDPIDGTKSFISGSPLFGMLIGVLRDESPEAGV